MEAAVLLFVAKWNNNIYSINLDKKKRRRGRNKYPKVLSVVFALFFWAFRSAFCLESLWQLVKVQNRLSINVAVEQCCFQMKLLCFGDESFFYSPHSPPVSFKKLFICWFFVFIRRFGNPAAWFLWSTGGSKKNVLTVLTNIFPRGLAIEKPDDTRWHHVGNWIYIPERFFFFFSCSLRSQRRDPATQCMGSTVIITSPRLDMKQKQICISCTDLSLNAHLSEH